MPHPKPDLSERTSASDAALAARLAMGDAPALEPLYRRYRGPVYRFALLWSGSPAVAADVTQDVFVHLLTRACAFDPGRGLLLPWLLGIARNLVRRRTATPGDASAENLREERGLAGESSGPDAMLVEQQDLEALRRAIAELPPAFRDVLVLVELAERSYAETAAICDLELNTVRTRLFRARRWLAQRLGGTVREDEQGRPMRGQR